MKYIKLIFFLLAIQVTAQQGGMWIPSLLEGMNESEMQNLGSQLTAKDIYDVNNSSLKDAIGHFNGGCTSEVISPKGLLLTNHHCGFSQIQSHSSLENDYLKDGFWAMSLEEEIPNEGLYVEFIVRIEDVTTQMLEGVIETMTPREKQSQIDLNRNKVIKSVDKEDWHGVKIRPFYKGNQYYLFVTERFEDVRLVGAPPSSIGKFGSDTDNWVWPRHTGDFSIFRIYADKNNRPAKYSKDNVPYKPKHYLPISLDGIEEGDFTMVFGFPGRTNEYLPAVAVEQITQKVNPSNIAIREAALKVIDANMKADDQIRIQYASKQARIANAWKKWIGENLGIEKSGAVAIKRKFESEFTKALKAQGKTDIYGNLLSDFDQLYAEFEAVNVKRNNFVEVFIRTNELMQMMFRLTQMENAANSGEASFEKARASMINRLKGIHKNYSVKVDRGVFNSVMPLYTDTVDESIYDKTAFTTLEGALALLEGDMKTVISNLNNDAAYTYAKPMVLDFYTNLEPDFQRLNTKINALLTTYMKALMDVMPEERYFPDANSTLRVTYGKVNGYAPRDAVYYNPVTYLDGVIEKYVPGDYEFDVPQKLRDLYDAKDYGQYADSNGKLPICFLGTNHTTGGNSGSPAIDAQGNLIGLNFDRVWEGTMSDIYYDPEICRNIMVDLRYVLFIVDKYAGASRLIDEMTLVHPKK
ncbi:S46 family peptidase [Psychroserpens sp.]|uniref:S46 family peptidase n=1 Tax=Psychroserpens sp. TaxID=2020870 RepID=UPI001AFE60CC|nr:S46 family peptidase [Psychroserpens sp.]MBO6605603.1 S46 family peptidase [Psychroserpens sp.]MBO6653588.1 S46 family peptidase [Psychroserpens sp.]MBO6681909.1 S46 family peptidase [Psychroserpens sp.]MBO6748977.1 S46 family peptidase [Psychroserpens sp.]MBO6915496.1 S46 family peptidase [Psychroserpens sp.]